VGPGGKQRGGDKEKAEGLTKEGVGVKSKVVGAEGSGVSRRWLRMGNFFYGVWGALFQRSGAVFFCRKKEEKRDQHRIKTPSSLFQRVLLRSMGRVRHLNGDQQTGLRT
jgi:hypothetical protein